MIGIVTAIYDRYDELKPALPQDTATDWVCVTDDPDLAALRYHLGWRITYQPRPDLHPNRAAKIPKMLPWRYTSATMSIWLDASFHVESTTFVREVMAMAQPIAQFRHPWRDCAFAEAAESAQLPKYAGLDFTAQMRTYRDLPRNWGLWATGVIAREHTRDVMVLGHRWLYENLRFTFQDQVSEPPMLWRHNMRPRDLPGNHLENPWVRYNGSGRH